MDDSFWIPLGILFVLGLIFFIFVLPIVTWKRTSRLARDSAKTTDVQSLIARIYALEEAIKQLRARPTTTPAASPIPESRNQRKARRSRKTSRARNPSSYQLPLRKFRQAFIRHRNNHHGPHHPQPR